jgi:NAD(P)H-dependent FMN reductase
MYKEYTPGSAPPVLENLAGIIRQSDGFIIVSGEYNHGAPAALKNLLDHFLEEWFYRPSAIACYSAGSFGGVRAAMQLRMTLAELGMASIPSMLPIPRVQDAFTDAGDPTDERMRERAKAFLDEFDWHAWALKDARARGMPGEPRRACRESGL